MNWNKIPTIDWNAIHKQVATQQAGVAQVNKTYPAKYIDPIESATDDVLILELIKRGYAVGKLEGQLNHVEE